VTLKILKDAANHHGLSTLFTIPSTNHYQSNPYVLNSEQQIYNFNQNISKTRSFIIREDVPLESMKILKDDQIFESKKEQTNLLKHMCLPTRKLQRNKSE